MKVSAISTVSSHIVDFFIISGLYSLVWFDSIPLAILTIVLKDSCLHGGRILGKFSICSSVKSESEEHF